METVAGIDLGTQSLKVVLYDWLTKTIVAQAQEALDLISEADGTREQKTSWYDDALKRCFDQFTEEERMSIRAIGVSGQQHGFVALDAQAQPLCNVKLWNDTSTVEECKILTEKAGGEEKIILETGNLMLPGFTAPKILFLKRHYPELFARLKYVLLPHDYVNFKLTDRYCAEYGDASGTALFNGRTATWSTSICLLIDESLFSILPELIPHTQEAGYVSRNASQWLGIPGGIPVSSGGGDNMMGAIGTGTVTEGVLTLSLGTSGTLYGFSKTPISNPEKGISLFCASSGGFLPLLCTMNCTVATEQTRTLLGMSTIELNEYAQKAPAGSDGIIFLPFFNGERTPNLPNARASICGMTSINCTKENIARASMEAAIFGVKIGLQAFLEEGFTPKEIRIIGGGAKSELWREMTANILNLPVIRPIHEESAALGAALQALYIKEKLDDPSCTIEKIVADHVQLDSSAISFPTPLDVEEYKKAYRVYEKYLSTLMPLYT